MWKLYVIISIVGFALGLALGSALLDKSPAQPLASPVIQS